MTHIETVPQPGSTSKIVIIAALEREIKPLIRNWRSDRFDHDGRAFTSFASSYATVVYGGIGSEAARRTAEAAIARYSPELIISAGVAGALTQELHVGETIFPSLVIDALDGSRHATNIEESAMRNSPLARKVLVSFNEIAGAEQKQKLGKAYGAQAVDMEAAAVALTAQKHGIPFIAIKAISDEVGFEMPEMQRFIHDGQFRIRAFVSYVILRPWLWPKVVRLARNTKLASENLCAWLRESALTHTIVPGSHTV